MGMLPLMRQIASGVQVGHVERRDTVAAPRKLGQTGMRRQSVRTRESPEVIIEGPVLLHDPDQVLDFVEAGLKLLRSLGWKGCLGAGIHSRNAPNRSACTQH